MKNVEKKNREMEKEVLRIFNWYMKARGGENPWSSVKSKIVWTDDIPGTYEKYKKKLTNTESCVDEPQDLATADSVWILKESDSAEAKYPILMTAKRSSSPAELCGAYIGMLSVCRNYEMALAQGGSYGECGSGMFLNWDIFNRLYEQVAFEFYYQFHKTNEREKERVLGIATVIMGALGIPFLKILDETDSIDEKRSILCHYQGIYQSLLDIIEDFGIDGKELEDYIPISVFKYTDMESMLAAGREIKEIRNGSFTMETTPKVRELYFVVKRNLEGK